MHDKGNKAGTVQVEANKQNRQTVRSVGEVGGSKANYILYHVGQIVQALVAARGTHPSKCGSGGVTNLRGKRGAEHKFSSGTLLSLMSPTQ